jgi:hypothetical protein
MFPPEADLSSCLLFGGPCRTLFISAVVISRSTALLTQLLDPCTS